VLLITHRIAGPAYRMRKEVELLNKGVYNVSFKLRARDELKDLAASLSVLASLMKKRHDYLGVKVAQLKEALRAQDSKAAVSLLEDIESTL
jgi:signal transduction histidine kinase